MNKEHFIKELRAATTKLPPNEQYEIIQDYEEYFAIGLLDGKTEEQISSSLGSPKAIGKELSATYQIEQAETNRTIGSFMRAMWTVIGLGFFNLVIVLGPFLVLASLLLSGWVAGIGFIAAPLLVLINVLIYPEIFELFDLFNSLVFCGLGIFIAIGTSLATKRFMNGFIRYMKFNTKLVKGGPKHA
ncbi:DUF1700 domain-containing protein [Sporosarcina oncorhynchi]|uniref:DUF1700 domain-containing protein n=1 Tax=Sporosarcina oncorhynchi TaxID=3056444 RepID=A0ABZ0L3A5_9BACL|nr:DUF1700 domain-containing protein [Sporosarcina sp. T2O-4]WOV86672.1 DUF1700 domain-containing protein [Sporosarcina sp. T2O-4]